MRTQLRPYQSDLTEDELFEQLLPETPRAPVSQRDDVLSEMLQEDKRKAAAEPFTTALASAQPLATQQDSDPLDEMWRDAEERYLREANTPVKGGVGQFLEDNSIGLLGTLLDLGLNKGRNIPRIMSESAQHQQRAIAGREAERDQAAQLANSARRQRIEAEQHKIGNEFRSKQQERWARLDEQSDRDYALKLEQQKRLAEKHDLDTNPNNETVVDLKEALYRGGNVPAGSLDGANLVTLRQNPVYRAQIDEYFKIRGIPIAAQQAGATSAAATGAEINTKNRLAGVSADTASQLQAAQAQTENALAGTRADTARQLGQVTEVEKNQESARARFAADVAVPLRTGTALANILGRKQEGQPIEGLGRIDRFASKLPGGSLVMSDQAEEVAQQLDLAQEFYSRNQSGAAIAASEAANFAKQMISDPLASAEQVEKALRAFKSANDTFIRSQAAVNPEAAEQILESSEYSLETPPARKPAPAKPAAQRPAAAQQGGRVRMQEPPGPNGEPGEVDWVEATDVEAAKAAGYRVVK